MEVFILHSEGTILGVFDTLEKAKQEAENIDLESNFKYPNLLIYSATIQ